ncbi:FkbM family methyltransferase [Chryseolinea sp. H1M3-3]|uniref:FkbM family methyltransferase n=1 Tax=Chryseolinea sp. H1M3-3 TaxID=3034144 RepID=UPI0023EE142D|nr:FkbM family methyltransferase [Chryseolinea sp. H1M3-3]
MKKLIKKIINRSGYEIKKIKPGSKVSTIGSDQRPVGRMDFLLQDLNKRGLVCNSVLDVGANKASWSRLAKRVFPSANFCLIEPQLEMKEELEEFCRDFEGSIYILAGAGSQKGLSTFTVWEDLAGSSFVPKPDENLKKVGKQREVEIIAIDDLIGSSRITVPELIKLDIQGYELEALMGASKTFGYTEAYIMEVSLFQFFQDMPIFFDVVNFMMERDYVVYDFPGFLRRPIDGALGQCDICFVKKNGFLRANTSW